MDQMEGSGVVSGNAEFVGSRATCDQASMLHNSPHSDAQDFHPTIVSASASASQCQRAGTQGRGTNQRASWRRLNSVR